MNAYSIALFLHIAGALGFFIVQGLEWMGVSQIRSAQHPEEARAVMGLLKRTTRLGSISMLTIFATGFYMMLTVWGAVPWLLVTLGAIVLEIVLFVALNRPRLAAVGRALSAEAGSLSQTFHDQANHPILWLSIYTRTAILLGIVFLKVAKPDLGGSLLTIAAAIVVGLAATLPALRRARARAGSLARMVITSIVVLSVVALALLSANAILAGASPLVKDIVDLQGTLTGRTEVPTQAGSAGLSTQAPAPSPDAALQEAQAVLQDRCTGCHSLKTVLEAEKTREGWEKTLSRMKLFGVKLSDTERNTLLDYLVVKEP